MTHMNQIRQCVQELLAEVTRVLHCILGEHLNKPLLNVIQLASKVFSSHPVQKEQIPLKQKVNYTAPQ